MSVEAQPVRTAVVTGGHSFEVMPFHELFRGMDGVDAYIQHMEDFCADAGKCRGDYEAVVFYHMFRDGPADDGPWYAGKQRSALEQLGRTQQGIFLLHHAILAYTDWDVWRQIAGIDGGSFEDFDHGEKIAVHVADAGHPITEGLSDWEIIDETYAMGDADEDNHVLLTTDHPKSLRTLAWTRQFRSARVFCLQLGHDGAAFGERNFRVVVQRGIRWVARQI